ncbi:MAG: DUF480 domain-containing protein [Proteobacteria bacterium]|nr:DUF480 domain-containing protein [Pseudomonadota bacterium]
MSIELTANEARVIGVLMEKSVLTPEVYPMTLNSLTNACNQKSSRDPVMALEPGKVQATLRGLETKHLVRVEENFKSAVEKYTQRLCNTPFSDYSFDAAGFAVICVLLLRGKRTPGELRANSGRLHDFADNQAVSDTLQSLIDREGGPVVVELPRTPGRRDPEYMHLLCGPVDTSAAATQSARQPSERGRPQESIAVEARLKALEEAVAELRALIEAR